MRSCTVLVSLGLFVLLNDARTMSEHFSEDKCYDPDQDFYPFMGSRTAYTFVNGTIKRPENTCVPKQLWMLARHGTRYPKQIILEQFLNLTQVRDQIIENHNYQRVKLCANDVKNLKNWALETNLTVEDADLLTKQGEIDHFSLAHRIKSAFPELFLIQDHNTIDEKNYVFHSTNTHRTRLSMESFAAGLFGNQSKPVMEKNPNNITFLEIHKNCPAWKTTFVTEHVTIERDEFLKGPEVRKVVKDVNDRLGFTEKMNYDQIRTMWEMCRYETAWYLKRDSPWCAIFNKEEMKIFEYAEDLDYYYCCSSGREMSKKIGCHSLSNMFEHFKKIESGVTEDQPKSIFLFGHSQNINPFFAVMGIGKESNPILRNNYAESENRNYRSSLLGPFAGNIIAVFYRCSNHAKSPNKVMFYVGENLKNISPTACKNGLCDWEAIKKEFISHVENCSTDFCKDVEKPLLRTHQTFAV